LSNARRRMNDTTKTSMYEACLQHSRADRALRLVVARELEEFNITMMQWLLLATVAGGQGSGMRMTELAAALDVTMPQITALMNDLVELKLAKQKINSVDRRSRRLMATPTGKKLISQVESILDKALRDWLKDIPKNDLRSFLATSRQIADLGVS
jgi:MarR family transcriptional regulator for hemolysin